MATHMLLSKKESRTLLRDFAKQLDWETIDYQGLMLLLDDWWFMRRDSSHKPVPSEHYEGSIKTYRKKAQIPVYYKEAIEFMNSPGYKSILEQVRQLKKPEQKYSGS